MSTQVFLFPGLPPQAMSSLGGCCPSLCACGDLTQCSPQKANRSQCYGSTTMATKPELPHSSRIKIHKHSRAFGLGRCKMK